MIIMKILNQTILFVLIFTFFPLLNSEAQVRIGGSIDIDIRVGLPDIIVRPVPRKRAPKPRPKRPVIIKKRTPQHVPCNCNTESYGDIINQNNGPRIDYQVIEGNVNFYNNNEIDLIFNLDSGDQMVITLLELKSNDYNFHYRNRPRGNSNSILQISINGINIPLNNAAVSLQPSNGGYSAVLNIHTRNDGDFNGTVQM